MPIPASHLLSLHIAHSSPSSRNRVKPPRCTVTSLCLPAFSWGRLGAPATVTACGEAPVLSHQLIHDEYFPCPFPPEHGTSSPRLHLRMWLGAATTAAPTALQLSHRTRPSRHFTENREHFFSRHAYVLLERALNTHSSDSLTCICVATLPCACFVTQAARQIVSHLTPCPCLFLVKCGILHQFLFDLFTSDHCFNWQKYTSFQILFYLPNS